LPSVIGSIVGLKSQHFAVKIHWGKGFHRIILPPLDAERKISK
jgi:hypothetical protein